MKGFLSENVDLMVEISEKIRQSVGIGKTSDEVDLAVEEVAVAEPEG